MDDRHTPIEIIRETKIVTQQDTARHTHTHTYVQCAWKTRNEPNNDIDISEQDDVRLKFDEKIHTPIIKRGQ